MSANRCVEGGYLGGTHLPIPVDPTEYRREFNDRIACNNLRCKTCGEKVRHLDGHRLAGWMDGAQKSELYDAPYPENTKYVGANEATREARVYFCRCSAQTFFGTESADLLDHQVWSCAGH
jgi:hypothetical protein